MSQKSRVVLRTKFEAGRTPTEKDFGDILDSGINKIDDQISIRSIEAGDNMAKYVGIGSVDPESPVSIRNRSGRANLLGFEDRDGIEKWQIEIDPPGADEGLSIVEKGTTDSVLFIESGGNIGIGTRIPEEKLHVEGSAHIVGELKAERLTGILDWSNLANVPVTLFVPKGVILMWSGKTTDIPKGWILCDGQNNAPDLRARFIVGAGGVNPTVGGGKYDPNNTGGSETVVLSVAEMPAHNHSASVSGGGEHTHRWRGYWSSGDDDTGEDSRSRGELSSDPEESITRNDGTHTHSVSIGNRGGGQAHENRPPYYALCFIMKT